MSVGLYVCVCVCVDCQLVYSLSRCPPSCFGGRGRDWGGGVANGGRELLLLFIMGCNIRAVANDKQV